MNGKKLNVAMQQYEIKTTSNQILNAYVSQQEEKEMKTKKASWWKWTAAFTTACSFAAIAYFTFLPNPAQDEHVIQDDQNNRVAYQLLSGIELSDFFNEQEAPKQRKNQRPATEDEFVKIVDVYDKANDMVRSAYQSKQNLKKTVYEGTFEGKYKESYPYKMEITGTETMTFYYDGKIEDDDDEVEMTIHGEIHQGQEIYRVVAETENSTEENEYEISIFFDENHYVIIEQEQEQTEFEYLYTLYENQRITCEIEFANEEGEQTLDIKENANSYEFQIEHSNSSKDLISYQTSFEAEGKMTIQYENGSKTYIENETQQKIVKNFQ